MCRLGNGKSKSFLPRNEKVREEQGSNVRADEGVEMLKNQRFKKKKNPLPFYPAECNICTSASNMEKFDFKIKNFPP